MKVEKQTPRKKEKKIIATLTGPGHVAEKI